MQTHLTKTKGFCSLILSIGLYLSALGQHEFDNYDLYSSADGLDQNSVRTIYRDSRGFLWVGTQGGVNCFDGSDWMTFNKVSADSGGLTGSFINCITETADGSIFIGSATGHLERWDPQSNRISLVYPDERIGGNNLLGWINHLEQDEEGRLWIATRWGLARMNNPLSENPDIKYADLKGRTDGNTLVERFIRQPNGDILTAGRSGLHRVSPEFLTSKRIYSEALSDIILDNNQNIWLLSQTQKLLLYHNLSDSLEDRSPEGMAGFTPHRLAQARDGGLWIATRTGGFMKYDPVNRKARRIPPMARGAKGFYSNEISSIVEDDKGILWLGSGFGLFAWKKARNKFKNYPLFMAHPENPALDLRVWSICKDSKERLWVGTYLRGLAVQKPGEKELLWFNQEGKNALKLPHLLVICVKEGPEGNIWVSGDAGLSRISPDLSQVKTFKVGRYNQKRHSNPGNVRNFDFDNNGILWAATNRGLLRFDPETEEIQRYWSEEADNPIQPESQMIFAAMVDSRQRLWLGTVRGLLMAPIKEGQVPPLDKFKQYYNKPNDPGSINDNIIISLAEREDGSIWAGTDLGLNLFEEEQGCFSRYEINDGLADGTIYGILTDKRGHLWMSTNRGISRFDPATKKVRNYFEEEGLQGAEFNSGAFFQAPDGELFFGGHYGLNSFYPESLYVSALSTPVVMTSIRVNDQNIFPRDLKKKRIFAHNDNNFRFQFAALDMQLPSQVEYLVRLEGYEDDWRNIGNHRFVDYTNLAPGTYTFHVNSQNLDGKNQHGGASFRFEVEAPWWQSWWFFVLLAAFICGLAGLIHLVQLRGRLQRFEQLERMRAEEQERLRKETSRDFHDEMGHKLTQILFLSHELQNLATANNPQSLKMIEEIQGNCQQLSQGTRDFIWTLDPDTGNLEALFLRLADFGGDLFESASIRFTVHKSGSDPEQIQLDMEQRRHLTLVLKEAMHNALKHAGASEVRFSLKARDQNFSLCLEDNGKGFDLQANSEGQGLRNMRERAKRVGMDLTITTEPEAGTLFCICSQGNHDFKSLLSFEPSLKRQVQAGKIRVALIEDQEELRLRFQRLIKSTEDMVLVGSYPDCETALDKIEGVFPRVVLLDMNLPGMSGLEGLPRVRKKLPDAEVLFYTIDSNPDLTLEALRHGASGYLLKDSPPDRILDAIREARSGGAPMSSQIARKVVQSFARSTDSPLSTRETEVLNRVASGMTFRAIAEELFVERETIKTHVKRIYKKLEVNSRAEAIRVARVNKFI